MTTSHMDNVLSTYRRHVQDVGGAELYVTGSVALHRLIHGHTDAATRKWQLHDMDTLVTLSSTQHVEQAVAAVRQACRELDGQFSALYFASHIQNHRTRTLDGSMRDVLAKCKCKSAREQHRLYPTVSTVFIAGSPLDHLKGTKAPALALYRAGSPDDEVWVANHSSLASIRDQHVSTHGWNMRDQEAAQIKYGGRQFSFGRYRWHVNKWDVPPAKNEASEDKHVHPPSAVAAASPPRGATEFEQLDAHLPEQQWRTLVTSKIHYRAGAAWRNLQLVQSLTLAILGTAMGVLVLGMKNAHAATTRLPSVPLLLPTARIIVCSGTGVSVGIWSLDTNASRAKEHQKAGARYAGLEREYALLRRRRLSSTPTQADMQWVDAHAINLQRRKTRLDARSPNAPEFWKSSVLADLAHKRYAPDA